MSGQIDNVDIKRYKDAILKSSKLIRKYLEKLKNENDDTTENQVSHIKGEIETILRYLSSLKEVADKETAEFIDILNYSGVIFDGRMDIDFFRHNKSLIIHWATESITISIQRSKPKWTITGGIKARLHFLEGFIEANRST
jgi:hypothetical protein